MRTRFQSASVGRPNEQESRDGALPGSFRTQAAVPLKILSILSPAEEQEFNQCEAIIERGRQTFLEVGRALCRIKEGDLFRTHYRSFEQYCSHRWQFGRAHAYRLIGAAQVVERLSPIGDIPGPTHESQVRPLLKVSPELAVHAWRRAVAEARGRPVTARLVSRAVAILTGGKPEPATFQARETQPPEGSKGRPAGLAKVLEMLEQLERMLRKQNTDGQIMGLLGEIRKEVGTLEN